MNKKNKFFVMLRKEEACDDGIRYCRKNNIYTFKDAWEKAPDEYFIWGVGSHFLPAEVEHKLIYHMINVVSRKDCFLDFFDCFQEIKEKPFMIQNTIIRYFADCACHGIVVDASVAAFLRHISHYAICPESSSLYMSMFYFSHISAGSSEDFSEHNLVLWIKKHFPYETCKAFFEETNVCI